LSSVFFIFSTFTHFWALSTNLCLPYTAAAQLLKFSAFAVARCGRFQSTPPGWVTQLIIVGANDYSPLRQLVFEYPPQKRNAPRITVARWIAVSYIRIVGAF